MSVRTPKRAVLSVVALFLLTSAAYGAQPSPRTWVRSAYDASTGLTVLFGGQSPFDTGTQFTYDSNETFLWNGGRWIQQHTTVTPPRRSLHEMVYDSARQRIVLFGGRFQKPTETTDYGFLNDTWAFKNNNWTQIETAAAPSPRYFPAMAYDPVRDRIILHGGSISDFETGEVTNYHDTWEFDGTNWTKVGTDDQIKVNKPLMEYHSARREVILLGQDDAFKVLMYRYKPDTHAWEEITFTGDAKKPDCVNDAGLVDQTQRGKLLLLSGICPTTTDPFDQTWEWNGSKWTENEKAADPARIIGEAVSYDQRQMETVAFGGTSMFDSRPQSSLFLYDGLTWKSKFGFNPTPTARSLGALKTDPSRNWVWLVSGLNEYGAAYQSDLWTYRGGQWFETPTKDAPSDCTAPLAAFDKDRNKFVAVCGSINSDEVTTHELDGTTWKKLDPKDVPDFRRWGGLVYDETLKKMVLFGGFDSRGSYRHDTWTWDGTNWKEIENDRPEHRALFAMWYDPIQKRTLLYGGLGRPNIDARVTRFSDMWAFTGDRWTKLSVSETPGERMGSQYVVQPDGKVLLFGGLRAEKIDPEDDLRRQFYDNETWLWDGGASRWTKLAPARSPSPRQNGMMAVDPTTNQIFLYGGYAGFFFSDLWFWNGETWTPQQEEFGSRRRPSR